MKVIVPIEINGTTLVSSSVPEPYTGEVAWNSSTNYAANDEVYLASTHRRYRAATANTNRNPATDTVFPPAWVDIGPTNRYAAFDGMVSTRTVSTTGTISYVLRPGYFSAISMLALDAGRLQIVVKDAPGGNVIYSYDRALDFSDPSDWYEYFFGGFRAQTDFIVFGIEPYNNSEVTITLTGGSSISVGSIVLGQAVTLGETQKAAKSKLIDYTRYKTDEFGNTTIIRRPSARDMTATVFLPIDDAPMVEDTLDSLRGVPAVWAATDEPNYKGLRTFGLGSGTLSYDDPDWGNVTLTLDIRGQI